MSHQKSNMFLLNEMRCNMYDFKNENYYSSGNLARAVYSQAYLNDNLKERTTAKVLNFKPRTVRKRKISAAKNTSSFLLKFACKVVFVALLSAIITLILVNLPQILNWLTNVAIIFFEFIFKLVEITFSLLFMIVFFFLSGIFIR